MLMARRYLLNYCPAMCAYINCTSRSTDSYRPRRMDIPRSYSGSHVTLSCVRKSTQRLLLALPVLVALAVTLQQQEDYVALVASSKRFRDGDALSFSHRMLHFGGDEEHGVLEASAIRYLN